MPPPSDVPDDDYVISLLKKDAEANQKRYLTSGLGTLLSKRPRGNAPKPNTRFLKNIIRETDSHNAALKAREEMESKARLKDLRGKPGGTKRSLTEDRSDEMGSSKRRKGDKPGRWASAFSGLASETRDSERPRKRATSHDDGRSVAVSKDRSPDRRKFAKDKRENVDARHRRHSGTTSHRSRSRSPSHRKERRRRSSSTPISRSSLRNLSRPEAERKDEEDAWESDPLENIIGPKPAQIFRPRGRGVTKPSNIDSRFDPSYNPKEDVQLERDEDRDDWDMALEALRDRAKWKAQGADRLRAAGFTDEEVSNWEKGGEKGFEDVTWKKKGEGREWDRGKVVGKSGDVGVEVGWKRLREHDRS